MSRYTGPKARINRRLGAIIFESAGAARASERRNSPPGMHPAPRKLSKYGEAMREKQKIKYYYGLGEKQLRRLYDKAQRMPGNTGENLLILCERRIDSVIRLAGLTKTRPQARQGVAHGHFLLNGRRHNVASAQLGPGDVVDVLGRTGLFNLYRSCMAENDGRSADWLSVDEQAMRVTVLRVPTIDDVTLPVDVGKVVELLSR
ncbi:30S ribosomal protein S4 [Aeoliella sp. SH292]|uniref:30S ribosomal protein S4 n=1 Tax=Aeoliella sp. SH292 TaxID=3454464 RepID=UPI003F95309F